MYATAATLVVFLCTVDLFVAGNSDINPYKSETGEFVYKSALSCRYSTLYFFDPYNNIRAGYRATDDKKCCYLQETRHRCCLQIESKDSSPICRCDLNVTCGMKTTTTTITAAPSTTITTLPPTTSRTTLLTTATTTLPTTATTTLPTTTTTVPTTATTTLPTTATTNVPTTATTNVPTTATTTLPTTATTTVPTTSRITLPTRARTTVPTTSRTTVPTTARTSAPTTTKTTVLTTAKTTVITTERASAPITTRTSVLTTARTSVPTKARTSAPATTRTTVLTTARTAVPTTSRTTVLNGDRPSNNCLKSGVFQIAYPNGTISHCNAVYTKANVSGVYKPTILTSNNCRNFIVHYTDPEHACLLIIGNQKYKIKEPTFTLVGIHYPIAFIDVAQSESRIFDEVAACQENVTKLYNNKTMQGHVDWTNCKMFAWTEPGTKEYGLSEVAVAIDMIPDACQARAKGLYKGLCFKTTDGKNMMCTTIFFSVNPVYCKAIETQEQILIGIPSICDRTSSHILVKSIIH